MIKPIIKIKNLLQPDDQKKLYLIVTLSLVAAILETISIASFLPIIEYFSGENVVGIYSYIENLNIPDF